MCLAVPAKILQRPSTTVALCDMGGIQKLVDISLVPDAQINDWIIVHVGFALNKINPEEAEKTLKLLSEISQKQGAHGELR